MTERWHCHKAEKTYFFGRNNVENATVSKVFVDTGRQSPFFHHVIQDLRWLK